MKGKYRDSRERRGKQHEVEEGVNMEEEAGDTCRQREWSQDQDKTAY